MSKYVANSIITETYDHGPVVSANKQETHQVSPCHTSLTPTLPERERASIRLPAQKDPEFATPRLRRTPQQEYTFTQKDRHLLKRTHFRHS